MSTNIKTRQPKASIPVNVPIICLQMYHQSAKLKMIETKRMAKEAISNVRMSKKKCITKRSAVTPALSAASMVKYVSNIKKYY